MPSDEFMEAINEYDCPEKIFKLAQTDFERAVAVEFFLVHKRLDKSSNDSKWLKYIVTSTFGVVVLSILSQYIPILLGLG